MEYYVSDDLRGGKAECRTVTPSRASYIKLQLILIKPYAIDGDDSNGLSGFDRGTHNGRTKLIVLYLYFKLPPQAPLNPSDPPSGPCQLECRRKSLDPRLHSHSTRDTITFIKLIDWIELLDRRTCGTPTKPSEMLIWGPQNPFQTAPKRKRRPVSWPLQWVFTFSIPNRGVSLPQNNARKINRLVVLSWPLGILCSSSSSTWSSGVLLLQTAFLFVTVWISPFINWSGNKYYIFYFTD